MHNTLKRPKSESIHFVGLALITTLVLLAGCGGEYVPMPSPIPAQSAPVNSDFLGAWEGEWHYSLEGLGSYAGAGRVVLTKDGGAVKLEGACPHGDSPVGGFAEGDFIHLASVVCAPSLPRCELELLWLDWGRAQLRNGRLEVSFYGEYVDGCGGTYRRPASVHFVSSPQPH